MKMFAQRQKTQEKEKSTIMDIIGDRMKDLKNIDGCFKQKFFENPG